MDPVWCGIVLEECLAVHALFISIIECLKSPALLQFRLLKFNFFMVLLYSSSLLCYLLCILSLF